MKIHWQKLPFLRGSGSFRFVIPENRQLPVEKSFAE